MAGLLLSPLILQAWGWRALFYTFGILGLPLLVLWTLAVPSTAAAAAGAGAAAAAAPSEPISLRRLLSKRATWAIVVANFVNHWGYFIYLNWMPTYFYRVLGEPRLLPSRGGGEGQRWQACRVLLSRAPEQGAPALLPAHPVACISTPTHTPRPRAPCPPGMDLKASSLLSFVPWLAMAVGSSAAGLLADGLVARGVPVLSVRRGMQSVAFLGPVLALLVLGNPSSLSPPLAVACLTAALGITSLGQAGFVANMSDIAPRHAGRLFGLCNTFGSFAGILGVSVVGVVVERTGSFALVFQATAALYVLGTIVWNAFCTTERQFE